MTDHATHCKDPHCYGCSCTPDCDYWVEEPNVLAERERIIALLEEQDYANGKAAHKENPLSVCNICRTIALIKGETE